MLGSSQVELRVSLCLNDAMFCFEFRKATSSTWTGNLKKIMIVAK